MASVSLQHVDKFFDDVHVVRNLDLEVEDGEFMILVGPSGCGKSTTLRMVAGLETVSQGELRIGDRVCNDLSPRERDIAMVFQSYALYPHMTVYENMAFGLRIRRMDKTDIDRRVREAAALLGLSDLLERRPKALSGGQRQRVAMGRAVVREPSVFLFDEPLSNLDAKLRVQMRLEVARLHKRLGVTIIYVTHDQVEAMTLADRIAVMHEGILQQCASPDEIYNRPQNTFVATFIGSPAMNLVPVLPNVNAEGRLEAVGNGLNWRPPESLAAPWQQQLGEGGGADWTVGVRPQDFEVISDANSCNATLRVDVVEPLGAETYVYGTFVTEEGQPEPEAADPATAERQASPAIVRVKPTVPVAHGELLHLRVIGDRAQVFDFSGTRMAAGDS